MASPMLPSLAPEGDNAATPALWVCAGRWPKRWHLVAPLTDALVFRCGGRAGGEPARAQLLLRAGGGGEPQFEVVAEWGLAEVGFGSGAAEGVRCLAAGVDSVLLLMYATRPVVRLAVYRVEFAQGTPAAARLLVASTPPDLPRVTHIDAAHDVVVAYSSPLGTLHAWSLAYCDTPQGGITPCPPPPLSGGGGRPQKTAPAPPKRRTQSPPVSPTLSPAPWDAAAGAQLVPLDAATGAIAPGGTDVVLKYYNGKRAGLNHELIVFSSDTGHVQVLPLEAAKRQETPAKRDAKRVGARMITVLPQGAKAEKARPKLVFYSCIGRGGRVGERAAGAARIMLPWRLEDDGRETWSTVGGLGTTGEVLCHSKATGAVMLFNTVTIAAGAATPGDMALSTSVDKRGGKQKGERIYAGGDAQLVETALQDPPPYTPAGKRTEDDEYSHQVALELDSLYAEDSYIGAKYLAAVRQDLPALVEMTKKQLEKERVASGMYKEERPLWRPILRGEALIPQPPRHTKGDDMEQYIRKRRKHVKARAPLSQEELAESITRMALHATKHDDYIARERARNADRARAKSPPVKKLTAATQNQSCQRLYNRQVEAKQRALDAAVYRHTPLAAPAQAPCVSPAKSKTSSKSPPRLSGIVDRLYTQGMRAHEATIQKAEDRFRFVHPAPGAALPRDEQKSSIDRMYREEAAKRSANREKLRERYLA